MNKSWVLCWLEIYLKHKNAHLVQIFQDKLYFTYSEWFFLIQVLVSMSDPDYIDF